MKIDINLIKNKLLNKNSIKKSINPHSHWMRLLDMFFVLFVGLILFSFFLLFKIKNQSIFQAEVKKEDDLVIINDKLLDRVNNNFDDKLQEENNIKNGSIKYTDPSI